MQQSGSGSAGNEPAGGRTVYLNGRYVPESEASVSIFDSALMFGDMVFEMTRSFNRKQFRLREHLERLYRGIKMLQITLEMSIDEMEKICGEVVERNRDCIDADDEDRLMIEVSRGPLSVYRPMLRDKGPTVVIADTPLSLTLGPVGHLYDTGIHAVVPSQRNIPAWLLDPKIKNRSRLHYMMGNIQASMVGDPDAWALLLDTDGFVAEGTGANFFVVVEGQLWTPEPRNILRGISRQYVMELAEELGIVVCEKNIEVYDVLAADEAFFTTTPYSILPCTKLDGTDIGDGKPGPVTGRLLDAWGQRVGVDIAGQVKQLAARAPDAAANPYSFNKESES